MDLLSTIYWNYRSRTLVLKMFVTPGCQNSNSRMSELWELFSLFSHLAALVGRIAMYAIMKIADFAKI